MEKRYKVVENVLGHHIDHKKEWVSFIVSPNSDFSLHYRLGETTWGVLGTLGVLVFRDLDYAIYFANKYISLRSFVPDSHPIPPLILEGTAIDERMCEYILCHEEDYLLKVGSVGFPPDRGIIPALDIAPGGTIRCAGFIPERVVKDYG